MTESEYIQQHETYLSSIVSRFIARYPEQRGKMRDDLMQEARIALLIAYRKQQNTAGLERRAYICIIDALYTAAGHAYIKAAKMLGMSKSACCRMQQRIRRYLTSQMRAK